MDSFLPQTQQVPAVADSLGAIPPDSASVTILDSMLSTDSVHAGKLIATGQFEEFGRMVVGRLTEAVAALVPDLLGAVFVLLLLYVSYRAVGVLLHRFLRRSKRVSPGLESLISKTYRILAIILIGVMVLAQFDVNVTALLAGLSIAGVAIGFAAKDTVENFISGITILLDKPFAIGDVIEVDGTYGTVEDLTLRSTRVRTLNRQVMVLPNLQMVNQKVINFSMLGVVRVDVDFGIAYKEYPEEARNVVLPLTENDDRLHSDFPPAVVVTGMNDSSVGMQLRLFLGDAGRENEVRVDYTERIREALREAEIEIPFPHLQLFVDGAKALERSTLFSPDSEEDG